MEPLGNAGLGLGWVGGTADPNSSNNRINPALTDKPPWPCSIEERIQAKALDY